MFGSTIVTAPPKLPALPSRDELEALIEEARRRQRKRRFAIGATLAATVLAAAAGILGYDVSQRGGAHGARAPRPTPLASLSTVHAFLVGAGTWDNRWAGILVVRPRRHRCTRVSLPQASFGYIRFSGRRYAYAPERRVVWVGRLGDGVPRKLRPPYSAEPFWVGGQLGLLERHVPRLHVGGRTITLGVPAGSMLGDLSSSHGRLALDAVWGNGRAGELHDALFVYAKGRTREVRENPMPYAGYGTTAWSPDGTRIAFFEDNDLWTMNPDGTGARRLTHTPKLDKGGPLLWSGDGRTIVYEAGQEGGRDPLDVYAEPAQGGPPVRLTHSRPPTPPVAQLGTRQLTFVGPATLAVVSDNSVGLLSLAGGGVQRICSVPKTGFSTATALPG